MLKKCSRCGVLCRSPDTKKDALCISCYNQKHHDYEKGLKRSSEWQKRNKKYFRDYQKKIRDKKKGGKVNGHPNK